MELKVLEEKKNKIILEMEGTVNTICNLVRKELWSDKNLNLAGSNIPHPLTPKARLIVEGDNPKKLLANAAKRLKNQLEKLKKSAKELK